MNAYSTHGIGLHITVVIALVSMGTAMFAKADLQKQRSVGNELGDPALGLVASILVTPVDQPGVAPLGSLSIIPKARYELIDRERYLLLRPKSATEPAPRHFRQYDVSIDGKLYQTTKIHPWWLPSYETALPYAPKTVAVTAYLSTGESFNTTVEVPADLRVDREMDIRAHEVKQVSDTYANEATTDTKGDVISPYRDQTGFRVYDIEGGGRGLTVATTCLSSKTSGRIVHSQVLVKRHYVYAPTGDLILSDTTFHQPVYGTDESVSLSSIRTRRADDVSAWIDPKSKYPAMFVLECRTEKDKVLRREFKFRWKYPDPASQGNDTIGP